MKSLFSGIEDVQQEEARNPFFKLDGQYVCCIEKTVAKESNHPDREGQPMFIVEVTIVDATEGGHAVGSRMAWIQGAEMTARGTLTTKGKRALGRVKNFCAAALGGVPDSVVTVEACEELFANDGEAIKGLEVKAIVSTGASGYTGVTWSAGE